MKPRKVVAEILTDEEYAEIFGEKPSVKKPPKEKTPPSEKEAA